ncbi:hypothetical protein BGW80DRAFT_1461353 [Lactifluus volemus]|nr:hypothetical protein BGW80DRAFT_1461353 [Lactifluus volemus]
MPLRSSILPFPSFVPQELRGAICIAWRQDCDGDAITTLRAPDSNDRCYCVSSPNALESRFTNANPPIAENQGGIEESTQGSLRETPPLPLLPQHMDPLLSCPSEQGDKSASIILNLAAVHHASNLLDRNSVPEGEKEEREKVKTVVETYYSQSPNGADQSKAAFLKHEPVFADGDDFKNKVLGFQNGFTLVADGVGGIGQLTFAAPPESSDEMLRLISDLKAERDN